MSDMFLFQTGPQGRGIHVDVSGRLVTTGDPVGGTFPFTFGDTGRVCVVDASGRLVITSGGGGHLAE